MSVICSRGNIQVLLLQPLDIIADVRAKTNCVEKKHNVLGSCQKQEAFFSSL